MDHKTIGIIGGGQLCKMLIEAGVKWDLKFNVLESNKTPSICNKLANCIRGSLHDPISIQALCDTSDVITYELEDINADKLIELENKGKLILPSPKILKLIQNKLLQKEFMKNNDIPTPKYSTFQNKDELNIILATYNKNMFVIKSCVGGYDGNGVMICSKEKLNELKLFSGLNLFEEFIQCKKELSVIVARDQFGGISYYPITEMVFNNKNTLEYQICPADISIDIELKAKELAVKLVNRLAGVGIFGVEMFLTDNDDVLINEISPRPHNSGHHTIESMNVSQFEQLLRILLGYPVKDPIISKPSITMNLLGPINHYGNYELDNRNMLMSINNCYIHMYGKQPSSPNRKLGHITLIDDNKNDLIEKFNTIKNYFSIKPINSINKRQPIVGIIMGSISDKIHMKDAIDILNQFEIPYEINIISAHRTPDIMFEYAKTAEHRGLKIIIAGAGGAAHLPGMTSSLTNLPVIGVPIKSDAMSGLDSLYSIVQMPRGVPVATMAINGSKNAAILAVRILSLNDLSLNNKLKHYVSNMHDEAIKSNDTLKVDL